MEINKSSLRSFFPPRLLLSKSSHLMQVTGKDIRNNEQLRISPNDDLADAETASKARL